MASEKLKSKAPVDLFQSLVKPKRVVNIKHWRKQKRNTNKECAHFMRVNSTVATYKTPFPKLALKCLGMKMESGTCFKTHQWGKDNNSKVLNYDY